jgi:hypothetical protein
MTPPAQRVQVLLKPAVLELVKQLSEAENLSLSKQVSQLVQEALEARGLYSRRVSRSREDSVGDFLREAAVNRNMTVTKKTTQLDPEDIELLQKLKSLKSLGLL